jgi:hypothetical protein
LRSRLPRAWAVVTATQAPKGSMAAAAAAAAAGVGISRQPPRLCTSQWTEQNRTERRKLQVWKGRGWVNAVCSGSR